MTQTQAKIERLTQVYCVLTDKKLENRVKKLEQMRMFYESKIPECDERRAELFKGFVDSLSYAITVISMHRTLTIEISELAQLKKDDK